ncbi:MAG: ATP-binding cassette domain-containing protein, partial [Rhodobacteraceae bacterium]|nr:ATP-binding cassette domain-containing protein [Paracoccaceae bacterium]
INPITRGLAALERGVEMLKDVQPEPPAAQPLAEAPQPVRGAIALQDVSVRYRDGAAFALDRVTLDIPAGETVALVGPSGAGKTTLVNLLPRFVRPDSGTVRIDGADTAHWPLTDLRRHMAMVSQDVVMLNASVAANVALGAPAVDRVRVEQCLADANLAEHVATLPQGIDTLLGHNATQL